MRPFVFLLLLLSAVAAHAEEPATEPVVEAQSLSSQRGFLLSVGSFFASPARYSLRYSPDTSFFGRLYAPEIGVGYLFQNWSLSLHVSAIGRATDDGDMRERTIRLHAPYRFHLSDRWEAKAGLGYLAFLLSGSASEVELSNGVGTQTFYVPGGARSTGLFYLTGGGAFTAGQFRFDADLLFTSLLNRRRGLHFALGAGYVF